MKLIYIYPNLSTVLTYFALAKHGLHLKTIVLLFLDMSAPLFAEQRNLVVELLFMFALVDPIV